MERSVRKHLAFALQISNSVAAQKHKAFLQMGRSVDEHHLGHAPDRRPSLQKEHSAAEQWATFLLLERFADEDRHMKRPAPEQKLSRQM